MRKKFFLVSEYFRYRWKALTAHGVHSPFIYQFIEEVLYADKPYYAFTEIEELRSSLRRDPSVLTIEDFGAGSHSNSGTTRPIASIVKHAARTPKFGRLLFRIVDFAQPKQMLELGTSLGIGSLYMAKASNSTQFITIEGSKEIALRARQHFNQLQATHITSMIGEFDTVLPELLANHSFDLVFIDGNHQKEPTIRYFEWLAKNYTENMILIFDDIHWSPDMLAAWEIICADHRVRCSIDIFQFGLVFFRTDFKEKQHFVLKF
jgi:predicted O-methyltransferase YrrM